MIRPVLSAALLLACAAANADSPVSSGGDFTVISTFQSGGGGRAAGGEFVVYGSFGQPTADALAAPLTGGEFSLVGGFRGVAHCGDTCLIWRDGFEDAAQP